VRRRLRRVVLATIGLSLVALVGPCFVPYPRELLEEDEGLRVLRDREGQPLRFLRDPDGVRHVPVRLEEVSPWLVRALVATEDRRFRSHGGVDPIAVVRAASANLRHGRIVSGASTITMQLARLLEPQERSFGAKVREAYRAVRLERALTKDEILERYLNLLPFGRNLRGVEAASRFWFGKPSGELTRGEAALLAGLPPSPSRLDPARHPAAAEARRRIVLGLMVEAGFLTKAEQAEEIAAPPRARPHAFPFEAPHFTEMARRRARSREAVTTLDGPRQREVAAVLGAHLADLEEVEAGAVVAIENASGAVRVLVGGPGWDVPGFGRLNLAMRRRSPGSALKPFLYALAIERGEILPRTPLADVPGGVAGYEPGNFDRRHRGRVPADEALRESLNVPAIRLLRRVGPRRFREALGRLGLAHLAAGRDEAGLALVLGGEEVHLVELARAYAALASGGRFRPLRLLADEPIGPGEPAIPAGVARAVADMLAVRDGPRTVAGERLVALKTGTSHGRRDAWAFAFDPDWTVGVWLGQPDGRPCERLVGSEAAAPLAREVHRILAAGRPTRWYGPAEGTRVEICAATGLRASPRCPDRREALRPAGARPLRPCEAHRPVLIDEASGHVRCPRCAAGHRVRVEVRLVLDPAVRAFLRGRGRDPGVPRHAPGCPARSGGPALLEPRPDTTYPTRVPLRARGPVDWFVDDRPLGRGAALVVTLVPGEHHVRAVGETGVTAVVIAVASTRQPAREADSSLEHPGSIR
jgi:penicillin-binding protein 1C